MERLFEEDSEEVGSEIEAFCPKCKADTAHVVASKWEDEIRRVQCNPCGDLHAFRKPRGDAEDETPEPPAAKKRAPKAKPTWEQVMAKSKKELKLYRVEERYADNDLISHPKFGRGFISEVIDGGKIEVTFENERRVLIHNRLGMSLPPAAYAHPVDSALPIAGRNRRKTIVEKATAAKAEAPDEDLEAEEPEVEEVVSPAGKKKGGGAAAPSVAEIAAPVAKASAATKAAAKPVKIAAPAAKGSSARTPPAPAKKPAVQAAEAKRSSRVAEKPPMKPAKALPTAARKPVKAAGKPVKAVAKPVKAVAKPVKTAARKPIKEAARKPIKEAARKPVKAAARKPVKEAARKPVKTAARKPVKEAARKPAKAPARKPAKPAARSPKPTKPAARPGKAAKPAARPAAKTKPSARAAAPARAKAIARPVAKSAAAGKTTKPTNKPRR